MYKSKLLRSLHILNAEDMKQLLPFLQSPYFNTNSNIVNLYRILNRYYPEFSSPRLRKEEVFKKLFPGKPYSHQQLLNLMSEFNALFEKYLIVKQLERKEMEQQKLLLEAYSERPGCYNTFEKKFILLNKTIDNSPFRDEVYYQNKKELNLLYYGHPDTGLQKGDKGTLESAIANFEAYKNLASIKLKCAHNARTNTIQNGQNLKSDARTLLTEIPLLTLYEKLEMFQRTEGTENFTELLDQFKLTIHLIRTEDQRNVLKILLNYATRHMNSGHFDFFHIAFDLYKIGLEYGCLLIHGIMGVTTFHNIITAGSICQEFDWTEKFIAEYQEFLDTDKKVDAVAMGYGLWYFEKKEYSKVVDILQHSFHEPLNVFKSKSLLIRSWFELWCIDDNYFDLFLTQLDTFEKYTRRDKFLTSKLKDAFLKFISFTKKLLTAPNEKRLLIKIHQEIEEEPNLVFKKWLLEKADTKGTLS